MIKCFVEIIINDKENNIKIRQEGTWHYCKNTIFTQNDTYGRPHGVDWVVYLNTSTFSWV